MSSSSAPLVVIDMGYMLFYRYHATSRYLRHASATTDAAVNTALFAKHLRNQLKDISSRFPGCGPLIICSDAPRASLWRRELYPDYKGKRKASPVDIGALAQEFIKIVLDRGDVLLEMPRMEADDLAYLTVRAVRDLQQSERPIAIITNDKDYIQLCAHFTGVRIYDATLRPVVPTSGDAQRDFHLKLLVGDRSDNILGVCTPPVASTLLDTCSWPLNDGALTPAKLRRLNFNEAMMDMRRIPKDLVDAFDQRLMALLPSCT